MPGTECEPTGRLRRLRGPGVACESARARGGPTGSVQLSVSLLMFELAKAGLRATRGSPWRMPSSAGVRPTGVRGLSSRLG